MDDHFWPSMYPGIIIGMLYGLGVGGMRSMLLGAAGGLAGTLIAHLALPLLPIPDGFLPFASALALAAGMAWTLVELVRRLEQRGM